MRLLLLAATVSLLAATGCSRASSTDPSPPSKRIAAMDEIRQEIPLVGFDPKGEPVIRLMADGSLYVVFNFMPPSYVPDEEGMGSFKDFKNSWASDQGAGGKIGDLSDPTTRHSSASRGFVELPNK